MADHEVDPVDRDVPQTSDTARLAGFSDALLAIVITLLVIEIRHPEAPEGGLARALIAAWPSYAAFVLAFVYVGVIWLNHHGLVRHVKRVDPTLHWLNLIILGTSALIPFPTGVLAEALQAANVDDQRAAVVLYALVAALMSAAWIPIFPYLERHRERLAPDVPQGFFRAQRGRPWVGVIAYAMAALGGWFINPWLAILVFAFMVVYHAWSSEGVSIRRPVERAVPHGGALRS